jgi:hypothetical protein
MMDEVTNETKLLTQKSSSADLSACLRAVCPTLNVVGCKAHFPVRLEHGPRGVTGMHVDTEALFEAVEAGIAAGDQFVFAFVALKRAKAEAGHMNLLVFDLVDRVAHLFEPNMAVPNHVDNAAALVAKQLGFRWGGGRALGINPDGDCVPSCCLLALAIQHAGCVETAAEAYDDMPHTTMRRDCDAFYRMVEMLCKG